MTTMTENGVADWVQLVQSEYREMPGLQLTRAQIKRLWGMEDEMCEALLTQLLASHFLRRTPRNAYVLDVPPC
jgi:hypothetical protein